MALEGRKHLCDAITVAMVILLSGGGGGGGGGGGIEALQYDPKLATELKGQSFSQFGYSVAMWKTRRASKIVVGAPKSTQSTLANNTLTLGAIHTCTMAQLPNCSVVPDLPRPVYRGVKDSLQYEGPQVFRNGTMGFGETLFANSRVLVACAPRYPVLDTITKTLQGRGACYMMDRDEKHTNVIPFTEQQFTRETYITINESRRKQKTIGNNSVDYTAYASVGFSAAAKSGGRDIFMGAPNAFRRQGATVSYSTSSSELNKEPKDLNDNRTYDDNLKGWATTIGYFGYGNSKNKEYLAVSQPGYGNLSGQVIFYDQNLKKQEPTQPLRSTQIGDWFGYSLATCDVDDDVYSDLLVGAPLTSRDDRLYPDEGMTYLFYAPLKKEAPRAHLELPGGVPWGRYGTAVACVNDLNKDNYKDVAIGAPGSEGGRVYIYKGGRDGLDPKPTQILHASEFLPSVSATYGFGFSLAGGLDMDNNGLPDILIGAPTSDAAFILWTSVVVYLQAKVDFDPSEIELSDKKCQVGENRIPVICLNLDVDMWYVIKEGGKMSGPLAVDLQIILDPEEQRVALYNETNKWRHKMIIRHNITCRKGGNPLRLTVYGKPQKLNYTTPVSATVKAKLAPPLPPSSPTSSSSSLSPPPPPPILDASKPSTFHSSLSLLCEDDKLCHSFPDLILEASGPVHLLVGREQLHLSVLITCLNDTAHDTHLSMTFPPDLRFESSNSTRSSDCLVNREEKEEEDGGVSSLLTCDFSNYLFPGEQVQLDLFFSQIPFSQLRNQSTGEMVDLLFFNLSVSSSSDDRNENDNLASVLVPRMSQVNLRSVGSSYPETVEIRTDSYLTTIDLEVEDEMEEVEEGEDKKTSTSVDSLGEVLIHRFDVINNGPSPLYDFQVEARLPLNYKGYRLLYLVNPPVTSGPLTCFKGDLNLNPAGFAVPSGDNEAKDMEELVLNDAAENNATEEMRRRRRKRREAFLTENPPGGVADEVTGDAVVTDETLMHTKGHNDSSSSSSYSSPAFSPPLFTTVKSTSAPPSTSTSPPPPPPSSSSTFSSSPPPSLSNQNKGSKRIVIDASKIPAQVLRCAGTTLRAGESAAVKVHTYLVTETVRRIANVTAEGMGSKQGATVILHAPFTFNTTQRCVYVNDEAKGMHGDDCLPRLPAPPGPRPQNASLQPTDAPQTNSTDDDDDDDDDDYESETSVFFEVKITTYIAIHAKLMMKKTKLTYLDGFMILVAITGGLLTVVILSGILYKFGFFKREKRLTPEQRQEMRRSLRERQESKKSDSKTRKKSKDESTRRTQEDSMHGNVIVL